jgi:hypothetical protein
VTDSNRLTAVSTLATVAAILLYQVDVSKISHDELLYFFYVSVLWSRVCLCVCACLCVCERCCLCKSRPGDSRPNRQIQWINLLDLLDLRHIYEVCERSPGFSSLRQSRVASVVCRGTRVVRTSKAATPNTD